MVPLKQRRELAIAVPGPGQRLFKKDAVAGLNHHQGVFAMKAGVGSDDGNLAEAGPGERIDVVEDRRRSSAEGEKCVRGLPVGGGYASEFAEAGFGGQFVNVKSMNHAHATEPHNTYANGPI